jgi:hypothetical protein
MPTTQRHALLLPLSLLALAIAAPACNATVIGGPLPLEQGDPAPSGAPVEGATSDPDPVPSGDWQRSDFTVQDGIQSDCDGDRYVKYVPQYDVWVGAILCSPTRYKLVMSDARDGLFLELTDYAGHGQDHCEIINPAFTIPNEDDITSGCPGCSIGSNFVANGPTAYTRGYFGEEFKVVSDAPQWAYQASTFIECAVSIP